MIRLLLTAAILMVGAVALAQSVGPQDGRTNSSLVSPTYNDSGIIPPPPFCFTGGGTIDLSTGCVQPMFGGL